MSSQIDILRIDIRMIITGAHKAPKPGLSGQMPEAGLGNGVCLSWL
jgi:hypothetical protein